MRSNAPMGPSCSFTLLRWVHRMTWLFVNCALLFRWKGKKMYFSSIYETFCMADLETIRWMVCLWMWTFPVPFYAFLYIICKSNSEFPLFYVMDVLVIDYFRLFKLLSNLELLEVTSCYWWGHYFFPFYWRFIFSIGIRKIIFTRAANHKHHIPLHVNVSLSKVTAHDAISIPFISLETRLLEDMTAPQHHMLVDITLQPCFGTPVDSNERIYCQIVWLPLDKPSSLLTLCPFLGWSNLFKHSILPIA
jgi:hypothetical protein